MKMKRYAVCPQSPDSLFFEGKYLKGLSDPIAERQTAKAAQRYASRFANDYDYGLVVLDTQRRLVNWGDGRGFVNPNEGEA